MNRRSRVACFSLVALLAALAFGPGARAQDAGTPVPTEPAVGSVTVVTVDQGGYALAGACYVLTVNGTVIGGPACAGRQGVVVFGDLPADGSYYAIGETRAPAGCEGQEVPGLTLTSDNPDQTQTVTNYCGESNGVANNGNQNGGQTASNDGGSAVQPPWTGTLTVHTVDQNGDALAGACYTLGTAPGFLAADGSCSGADGTVVFSGFWARDGNVQLTQTKAGPGCQFNGNIPSLTFSKANATQEITITDTCQTTTAAANASAGTTRGTSRTIAHAVLSRIGKDLPLVARYAAAAAEGDAGRG